MGRMHEFWAALEDYETAGVCEHPKEAREKVSDGAFLAEVCTACGEEVGG